jgi:hypothetical protein
MMKMVVAIGTTHVGVKRITADQIQNELEMLQSFKDLSFQNDLAESSL